MGNFITVVERGSAFKITKGNKTSLIPGFRMFEYPITTDAWKDVADWANEHGYFLGHSFVGSTEGDGNLPKTYISWVDAAIWCNALSEKLGVDPVYLDAEGEVLRRGRDEFDGCESVNELNIQRLILRNGYRLPTLLEWQVAAWGADTSVPDWNYEYAGGNELAKLGWYGAFDGSGNADGLHQVAQLKPNRLGLYDMCGNVAEYCDQGEEMGGSWYNPANQCAILWEGAFVWNPASEDEYCGFRPVQTLVVQTEEEAEKFVGINSSFLRRVPETLRTEKVCLAAVKKNGKAMEHVPEVLKARISELLKNGGSPTEAPQVTTPATETAAPPVEPPPAPAVPPPLPGAPAWQNLPPIQYYVGLNGQQAGPFDWAELDSLIKKGGMNSQTLVWKAGFANWTPASDVSELKVILG